MKRTLILSFGLAFLAPMVFVGCGDTTEVKKTEVDKTPGGKVTKESSEKITKEGDAK